MFILGTQIFKTVTPGQQTWPNTDLSALVALAAVASRERRESHGRKLGPASPRDGDGPTSRGVWNEVGITTLTYVPPLGTILAKPRDPKRPASPKMGGKEGSGMGKVGYAQRGDKRTLLCSSPAQTPRLKGMGRRKRKDDA